MRHSSSISCQYRHRPEGGQLPVNPKKSEQERWLAEAASALAEAGRLTVLLAFRQPRHGIALASLQAEIMTLRREIERVQRDRIGERRREYRPDWTKHSVWPAAAS
jgi:hypothetical protein